MTNPSLHISVYIDRSYKDVYDYISEPLNMPKWAAGLSHSLYNEKDYWISESPMGKIKVRFAPRNEFGIMDHEVILEDGKIFYNPLRVLKNKDGSEVVFTLFRQPEMSDDDFKNDENAIKKDLQTLKTLLER